MRTFHSRQWLVLTALLLFFPILPLPAKTIDPDTVPELIRQLGEPPNPFAQTSARYKLSRRLTLSTIEVLIAEIRKKKGRVRDECISVLRWDREPLPIDLLLPLLNEHDVELRRQVLELLSRQKDSRLIPVFEPLLVDKTCNGSAIYYFMHCDPPTVDKLLPLLKTVQGGQLGSLIQDLGRTHDARVLPEMVRLANDTNDDIRSSACRALFECGREGGIEQLCLLLRHENIKVRLEAVQNLGYLEERNSPTVLSALLNAVHDPAPAVRVCVLKDLSAYQNPRAREAGIAMLHDPDAHVRIYACESLKADIPRYLVCLGEQLNDPDSAIRGKAAVALANFNNAHGVDILLSKLHGPKIAHADLANTGLSEQYSNIPTEVAGALLRLQEPQAIPLLVRQLRTVDDESRPAEFNIETEDSPNNTGETFTNIIKQTGGAPTLLGRVDAMGELQQIMSGDITGGMAVGSSNVAELLSGYGTKAIDSLIASLHDPDPAIRSGAGLALGMIGNPWSLSPLSMALKDPQSVVRRGAIAGLAILEDVRAVPPLLEALQHEKDKQTRLELLSALTEFREPEIVTALLPICRDRDNDMRKMVIRTIRKFDDPRVSAMLAALKDHNTDVREEAAKGGAWANDPKALSALIHMLGESERSAFTSADTLRRLAAPAALPLLLDAVKSDNQLMRANAVSVLSVYRDPRVVDVFIGLLSDKNSVMREEAIESLKTVIVPSDLPRLLPLLTILPSSADREHLVRILGAAGGAAVAPLTELSQDESPDIRQAAAQSLGLTGDARAVDPLVPLLDDPDGLVRYFAIRALEAIGSPCAVEPLLTALHKYPRNGRDYITVFSALHKLHDARTVELIIAMLSAPSDELNKKGSIDVTFLLDMLVELGDVRTIPVLVELLTKGIYTDKVLSILNDLGDAHPRAWLLASLGADTNWALHDALSDEQGLRNDGVPNVVITLSGRLREPRAVPGLLLLLREHNAAVAASAATALGQIADPATADALLLALERGASDNTRDFAGTHLRHAVAHTLGQLKTDAVRQQLQARLASENWRARAGAAEALGVMGDSRAVEPLLASLHDRQPQVRAAAAQALGALRDAHAITALQDCMHDPYLSVRLAVARALNTLGK